MPWFSAFPGLLLFLFLLGCCAAPWVHTLECVAVISSPISHSPPDFDKEIRPLLRTHCGKCHAGTTLKGELDLSSLDSILKGGESGPAVVVGQPEKSPLLEKIIKGEMPPGKKNALTGEEIHLLETWIKGQPGTDPSSKEDQAKAAGSTKAAPNQHDILPIMLRHCTVCHGAHRREGNLDLRSRASMIRGGKSGPAIVPGNSGASLLLGKIREGLMPPKERLVEASVKPLEPNELDLLTRWVEGGAPEVDLTPDVVTTNPDPLVSDGDRNFWAFQPPRNPDLPRIQKEDWPRNSVDRFILVRLEAAGIQPNCEADKATLFRRASFDLTGLPPDPRELREFLDSPDPQAYEKAIDRMLASPRYGERWGRYWLDLIGYADSEGKREQDLPRPHAWRYRDYVIRSLNADKPYNQFLVEQIAGDELFDHESAETITETMADQLIATGFLRMVPDATWANITGYVQDRVEVIADEMDVLGSALLGLTLKCARCHSHKFDPIPQRDYYRLLDVFKGALDEYDWLKPDVRPGLGPVSQDFQKGRLLKTVSTRERKAWEQHEASLTSRVNALRQQVEEFSRLRLTTTIQERLADRTQADRLQGQALAEKGVDAWTPSDRAWLKARWEDSPASWQAWKKTDPPTLAFQKKIEAEVAQIEAQRRTEPMIQALWDRGDPSPTYIYRRGDPLNPGRLVGPGVPSVLTDGKTPFVVHPPWPGAKKTGRRLAFARWLTQPNHPLTARVLVNRVWKHQMGRGIVKSLGNFGKAGTPPTHPELLDWLAIDFVEKGWSLKRLHWVIMTSSTYRQSSQLSEELTRKDPDNQWFGRMPMTRLDAEAIHDTMVKASGQWDPTPFGPADPVVMRSDGLINPVRKENGWRRLVYVSQKRKQIATALDTFDFPQMNPNCLERRDSMVAPQALHLMNHGLVRELADRMGQRVFLEAGPEATKQVELVYALALGRPPWDQELKLGVATLSQLRDSWKASSPPDKNGSPTPKEVLALGSYCHTIFNSAAFLFVD